MNLQRPRRDLKKMFFCCAITVAVLLGREIRALDLNDQPFTVEDSIKISYLINPAASTFPEMREVPPVGVPICSPDRKRFLLITQRGLLATNSIESTLWLFDSKAVLDYLRQKAAVAPAPKPVAVLSAESNTPVISDVRWFKDSDRIAFLGKPDGSHQQLFVASVISNSVHAATSGDAYVTQFDISGDTIAYTTLIIPHKASTRGDDLVDVTGKSIYALLFPESKELKDEDEWALHTYPNALHVLRNGREVQTSFTMDGRPLRLFSPTLSLSPDGKSLITVAPVHRIPATWAAYQPAFDHMESLNLKPDNQYALADENPWKASQYVIVDLNTGVATPIVEAPAGRALGYVAATRAFWLGNGQQVVLTNSFLPLEPDLDEAVRPQREKAPAMVMVDLSNRKLQPIDYISQGDFRTRTWRPIDDISWRDNPPEITVTYGDSKTKPEKAPRQVYGLESGSWVRLPAAIVEDRLSSDGNLDVSVNQDLNHPPALFGQLSGAAPELIWDPNPLLRKRDLGQASLYTWQDKNHGPRAGILVLPPRYDPQKSYPLVIQTHGYDSDRFFADGQYTTGSGGRALSAKGIIVLQMDMPMTHFTTPEDGPYQLAGFESAIESLSSAGLIDPHRVGVIGFSYSCFHVLYALTHHPGLFAAASITDGNNMSYVQYIMLTDTNNALQEISEKTNGGSPFGSGLVPWAHGAPNFSLDQAQAPLLISSLETGELVAQWETYSGLRRLKKPVEMVWLPKENAPHILIKPRERYSSQQQAVDWFDFWLNGREDSDAAKQDQYRRWRELRNLQSIGSKPSGPTPN